MLPFSPACSCDGYCPVGGGALFLHRQMAPLTSGFQFLLQFHALSFLSMHSVLFAPREVLLQEHIIAKAAAMWQHRLWVLLCSCCLVTTGKTFPLQGSARCCLHSQPDVWGLCSSGLAAANASCFLEKKRILWPERHGRFFFVCLLV